MYVHRKYREINSFFSNLCIYEVKKLLSRNFCQKAMWESKVLQPRALF